MTTALSSKSTLIVVQMPIVTRTYRSEERGTGSCFDRVLKLESLERRDPNFQELRRRKKRQIVKRKSIPQQLKTQAHREMPSQHRLFPWLVLKESSSADFQWALLVRLLRAQGSPALLFLS